MKRIDLYGVAEDGTHARIGADVVRFENDKKTIIVTVDDKQAKIRTYKGDYTLDKHDSQNTYMGLMNGIKAHVSVKKIKGELRYWPKEARKEGE